MEPPPMSNYKAKADLNLKKIYSQSGLLLASSMVSS